VTLQRESSRGHIVERSSVSEEVERCPYSTLAILRWMGSKRRRRARRLALVVKLDGNVPLLGKLVFALTLPGHATVFANSTLADTLPLDACELAGAPDNAPFVLCTHWHAVLKSGSAPITVVDIVTVGHGIQIVAAVVGTVAAHFIELRTVTFFAFDPPDFPGFGPSAVDLADSKEMLGMVSHLERMLWVRFAALHGAGKLHLRLGHRGQEQHRHHDQKDPYPVHGYLPRLS